MRPIKYVDYQKISDNIYFLGNNTVLRFNVLLSGKRDDGTSNHFHKEYMYNSNFVDREKNITIRRTLHFHLSIDKTDIRGFSIIINPSDMYLLRAKLKEASIWFNDGTFASKDEKLIIKSKKPPIKIPGLAYGNFLMFEPVVIQWENTGQQEQVIRMTMSYNNIYTDIPIDKFYGMMYMINTLDMYQMAAILVNYLGRPEYGTNLYEFENDQFINAPEEGLSNVKENRQIPSLKNNKSYFDKIDNM